ncbi:MAG: hypothetical protein IPK82_39970 [Polyangiaceae bacterium]|nr:hypothetical protein [Polyangiaceae bacterium]
MTVRVPDGAAVSVNGERRTVENGHITLVGEAGDSFLVAVSAGAAEKTVRVILSKDGAAEPSQIDLPTVDSPPDAGDTQPSTLPTGSTSASTSATASTSTTTRTTTTRTAPTADPSASSTASVTATPVTPIETW